MKKDIHIEETYPYPPERIWRALTNSDAMADWLMPNTFDPKIGCRFQFRTKPAPGFDGIVNCEVLELDAPNKLVFSWCGGGLNTVVRFNLEAVAEGTHLRFEHTGFSGMKGVMVSTILAKGWKSKILSHNLPSAAGRFDPAGGYRTLAMDGIQRDCA